MHLAYAIESYLKTLDNETTRKNYKVALEEFSTGITFLTQITTARINSYKNLLGKKTSSTQTITARLAAIRSFCDYCWMQGWISENPGLPVKPERVVKYDKAKRVSFEDFEKLLKAINVEEPEGLRDFILLRMIFLCGDHNKVLELRFSHPLPGNLGKYKEKFQEMVKDYKKVDTEKGYLFFSLDHKNNSKTISYATARRILLKRLQLAGFEADHMDFPAIKRIRAKQIYEKTKSAKAVQEFCGHKSLKITKEFLKTL